MHLVGSSYLLVWSGNKILNVVPYVLKHLMENSKIFKIRIKKPHKHAKKFPCPYISVWYSTLHKTWCAGFQPFTVTCYTLCDRFQQIRMKLCQLASCFPSLSWYCTHHSQFSLTLSLCDLFIYLFINSIPKSKYRSSSNGYRNRQRISNLALCNSRACH